MRLTLAVPMILLGLPALAGSFTPPQGCAAFLTVQSRGCYVANYYRCEADAAGDQWRADFDQEGLFYLSRIDFETQWVESFDVGPKVTQTLDANPVDGASFSGLLSTDYDSFAFQLSKDDGAHSIVRGFDRLTGKKVVIDGINLEQTEFEFTETDDDGKVLRQAKGNEYIHPKWRLFFSGQSEWPQEDGSVSKLEGSPVQFVMPGEPGFANTQPIFECDVVTSSLPQSLRSLAHDNL